MPTYEYLCTHCNHQFDIWQEVGAEPPACPECGSVVKKVFRPVSIHYKGSGFYVTDSRPKSPAAAGEASSTEKTETKTEAKPDGQTTKSDAGSGNTTSANTTSGNTTSGETGGASSATSSNSPAK
jgi:putative FmdB family regulatory protein